MQAIKTIFTCCFTTKFLTPSITNFELFDNKFENMLKILKLTRKIVFCIIEKIYLIVFVPESLY